MPRQESPLYGLDTIAPYHLIWLIRIGSGALVGRPSFLGTRWIRGRYSFPGTSWIRGRRSLRRGGLPPGLFHRVSKERLPAYARGRDFERRTRKPLPDSLRRLRISFFPRFGGILNPGGNTLKKGRGRMVIPPGPISIHHNTRRGKNGPYGNKERTSDLCDHKKSKKKTK